MSYPEYVKVDDREYKINTDFRIALKCNQIAQDNSITEIERGLAVIYVLFGEDGINNTQDHQKLLELAKKYLSCGKELTTDKEADMDYIQDMDYIEASFMSDYHIDLTNTQMHWWKFYNLMNGLSNSELGDCCILNRIRNLRNFDTSKIKDQEEKQRIEEEKKQFSLKKKEKIYTDEEKESMDKFNKLMEMR